MTGPHEQAAALRRLVDVLDDAVAVLDEVRGAVAGAWDDPAGRGWTDRLDLVRRAADRLAGEGAARAREWERIALDGAEADPAPQPPDGIRLPGVTGVRTDQRRGTVAPLLPPAGPG